MTIKDAVELYNGINDKITDIKNTLGPILKAPIIDPLGNYYKINQTDMVKITNYLTQYIKVLEQKLEEEYE